MMDVESLRKSGSSRLRCLDVFLVVSIVFLFVAVGFVTVGLVVFYMCDKTASSRQPHTSDAYKMQNFAYLRADTNELKNGTMKWTIIRHGEGTSVGSLFVFHERHHSIKTTQDGHYFIYIDLKLTCSFNCNAGQFTVSIGDRLTCTFELPQWAETTPVYRKCWQVTRMDKDERLITQMSAPKQLDKWTIDVAASGLGIYLVD
ncbi:unnamed protein product [Lota lota]